MPLRPLVFALLTSLLLGAGLRTAAETPPTLRRVGDAPIVTGDMLPGEDGASINGPSLIRVPDWVEQPLGRYYLYFSHHAGKYLRLAYADRLEGPWKIAPGGVLALDAQATVADHIASPQVVVDEAKRRFYLYYHGGNPVPKTDGGDEEGNQVSGVAVSADGRQFTPIPGVVGPAYLQVFPHGDRWFALNHTGVLRAAAGPEGPFLPVAKIIGPDILDAVDPARLGEPGAPPAASRPTRGPFRYTIRHVGVAVNGDRLDVYFSCVGHRPERILRTTVALEGAPEKWIARGVAEILRPEKPWEGADLPLAYSRGGIARKRLNELRDPAVLSVQGRSWLVYAIAGEHGLGLAEIAEPAR
jgi:hypothetical protein